MKREKIFERSFDELLNSIDFRGVGGESLF